MNWIKPSDIREPQRSAYPSTADFDLAYDVWAAVQNAGYNFLTSGNMGTPQEYMSQMVQFAFHETQNNYLLKRAPADWNWALEGVKAALQCFTYLSKIPVAFGDPNTVSVMEAWETGKGKLYGGHDPLPPPVGGTSATDSGAAPASSILGHAAPPTGGNVSIFGQPQK